MSHPVIEHLAPPRIMWHIKKMSCIWIHSMNLLQYMFLWLYHITRYYQFVLYYIKQVCNSAAVIISFAFDVKSFDTCVILSSLFAVIIYHRLDFMLQSRCTVKIPTDATVSMLNFIKTAHWNYRNVDYVTHIRSGTTPVWGTSRDWGSPPDRGTPYLGRGTPKLSSRLCRKQFANNFNHKVNNFFIALELPARPIIYLE